MSGVHRFLSKREKHRDTSGKHVFHKTFSKSSLDIAARPIDPKLAADFYGLFNCSNNASGSDEESKVKAIRHKVVQAKGVLLRESNILWALRSEFAHGDVNAAFDFLLAMSDASEGLVQSYDPSIELLGAQNRQGVTCFLDSTLFSMFSRLDSFEAMLYNSFDDIPRNRLGFLLRLWVNLLRAGKLITTDVTHTLQLALAENGWKEAAELHQQDASEAFSFITERLELPLLTLKMDIYHTGKEDAADDHKFINERLLEVAIPYDSDDPQKVITLEECLEEYFNNRIEVRRYLERRSTLNSVRAPDAKSKSSAIHIETLEVDSDSSPATPVPSSPGHGPPRPGQRHRAPSIIQERYFPTRNESGYSTLTSVDTKSSGGRLRAGSIRKEVMMPAWQFFSLIPWYTDNAPKSDAQVAAHFSSKRPVLGLCLKRYTMTAEGPARLGTQVDIPVEIGLPHFIQDDHFDRDGPAFGNFKLSLQAVVCHRGNAVDSGHYIALVRSTTMQDPRPENTIEDSKHWMRFDDLAQKRITLIDVEKALKEETPYLLFYQIVPIDGDSDSSASETVFAISEDTRPVAGNTTSVLAPALTPGSQSARPSLEVSRTDDRARDPVEARRHSAIAFSDLPENMKDSIDTKDTANGIIRTTSKGNDGLTRALSKLRSNRGQEALPQPIEGQSEIKVRELSETNSTASVPQLHTQPKTIPHKVHKREKSKNRLGKMSGRSREDKPDRECSVM